MKKLRFFDSLKFVVAAIVCTFILNVAHAAILPAGYTELEYIESTGTQYIDTGVNIGENIQTKVKFGKTTNSFSRFGFVIGGGGHYQGLVTRTSTNSYYSSMYSPSQNTIVMSIPDNVFEITFNTQGHKVILNNASYDLVLLSPYEISNTIGIFRTPGTSSTNNGIGKVYSFVITDNLTNYILFNGIPVRRDSDGMLGMYDLADANPATAFHTNAGTGTFIAGEYPIKIATTHYNETKFAPVKTDLSAAVNAVEYVVSNTMSQAQAIDQIANEKQTRPDEGCTAKYCLLVEDEDGTPHWYPIAGANGVEYVLPAGYTQLEYIESDGHSYLIVPYRVNNKTVFYARYNETQNGTSTASVVFGVTSTPDVSKANYGILRLLNGIGGFNRMGWGDSTSGSVIDVNAPQNLNTWYEVLYDQNKLYQDNVLYATSATSNDTEWVANYDLGIFARNGATVTMPAIAKISSVWAKEDGEYKINLVPAKDSSGVIGMYDMVSGQFFTNQGTGEFGEGPVVE